MIEENIFKSIKSITKIKINCFIYRTVKRDGKGFDPQVKDGETVKKGQLLMKFDLDGIKADGYDVTTPIVVTNADEFTIKTVAEGAVVPGAALLKLEANK